ncbi:MAG: hypothetical protein KA200_00105 [Burkholderiales bacterium]|nr:hypothetical protein [Burkholderiales bacterium]
MATEVQIANLALSHIGHKADVTAIDGTEASREAELCTMFYPQARDVVLERHPWKFTMRRAAASAVSEEVLGWDYVYAMPTEYMRIHAVLPEEFADEYEHDVEYPFQIETLDDGTEVIVSDVENAVLRFQVRVTDTAKFPPSVTSAISYMLASLLAGPLIKGGEGIAESKRCREMAEVEVLQAMVNDGRQRKVVPEHVVPWLAVR